MIREGYVYVCDNPAMPGYVKIGRSGKHPEMRMDDLHTAAIPFRHRLLWYKKTCWSYETETKLHNLFGRGENGLKLNVGKTSEWYRVPKSDKIKDTKAIFVQAVEEQFNLIQKELMMTEVLDGIMG